jgi:hypothetical protein
LDTPWTAAVREGLAWKRFAADSHRFYPALRLGRLDSDAEHVQRQLDELDEVMMRASAGTS